MKKGKFFLVGFLLTLFVLFGGVIFGYFFQNKTLGADKKPELFISGKDYFDKGGLISLAVTDNPLVTIGGYNISGEATVDIYKINTEDILKGLLHNKDNDQINSKINFSKFEKVATFSQNIESGYDNGLQVSLPLYGSGEWLVDVSLQGVHANAYIVRSDIGALVKEGDNELIFWMQSFSNKKSLSGANVAVYNLEDKITKRYSAQSDNDGIAKTPISENDDIAIVEKDGDISLVPINLRYINSGYSYKNFIEKNVGAKAFTFTDRPLYSPGSKVYFKSIIREDDDARYSIMSGNVYAEAYTGWGKDKKIVYGGEISVSLEGSVSGEFDLPENSNTGAYTLEIRKNKDVSLDDIYSNYISKASFDVDYFQKPEYGINLSVEKSELISGDKFNFSIEGNYFSGQPLSGKEVSYKIYSSDFYEYAYYNDSMSYNFNDDYRYGYYSSDKVMEGNVVLDENGRASIGVEAVIPDKKNRKSKIFSIEASLKDDSGSESFERKNVLVRSGEFGIYRESGTYGGKVGQEISFGVMTTPNVGEKKLEGEITRIWWEKYKNSDQKYFSYTKKEESAGTIMTTTDNNGKAEMKFTPEKEGSYNVSVMGMDGRGNKIYKTFYFWISDKNGYYSGAGKEDGLTVKASKEKYDPSEEIQLTVHSEIPDRDVFLSIERGRVDRYRVVHLKGNNAVVDIPIKNIDIPNVFAYAGSFSDSKLESFQENVEISSESKKINVSIIPDKVKYAPGDTALFTIKTTDYKGQPISVDLAVWSVDKALFELMNSSTGDIFKTFWSKRYNDTQNSNSLVGISIFAAEKGGGGGGVRGVFKDTAYWNPNVHTDSDGYAEISFKLPDNLTTWVLSAVGDTKNTEVGQITNEIMVTKDVIIRPVLPNILRNDNEVVLSALAQNFTDSERSFSVKLEFDAGEVENPVQEISIDSSGEKQVFWKIHPTNEDKEDAQLKFYLISDDGKYSDVVFKTIPLRKFGFWETNSEFNINKSDYVINLSKDDDLEKTEINLSLSSTLVGSLSSAIKYLIGYPYGCVEQTTSRFVPAVIAGENPDLFKESIENNDIKDIIATGIDRLENMQGGDGGWSWWGGDSDYFVSAYVVEYLTRAKNIGAEVNEQTLNQAKAYFEKDLPDYGEDWIYNTDIIRSYALSFFGEKKIIENYKDGTSPDILAMAVMSNIRNGIYDPAKNGRNKLIASAKSEGNSMLFWDAGVIDRFGSAEGSTGMALRAWLAAGGDKETASKMVNFLTNKRKNSHWRNTFSTSQSIQSLVDFSKTEKFSFPQYSYEVELDGVKIAEGVFNEGEWQNEINIPANKINPNSSVLKILKNGEGQMYSHLSKKEFHLDRNTDPLDKGIKISRTYTNEKGKDYPIGVGDIIDVEIEVDGSFLDDDYVVVEDQLPAGLVPINANFKNSQAYYDYRRKYDGNVKNITENGIVFAARYYNSNNKIYTYKARAVSEGDFLAPPVVSSLMYSPDIYGRSGVQNVKIVGNSNDQKRMIKGIGEIFLGKYKIYYEIFVAVLFLISFGAVGFMIYRIRFRR